MRFTSIVSVLSTVMLLQACGGDEDSDKTPVVSPAADQSVEAGATRTYTITGLDDDQAYRVTLVVAANVTVSGSGGTFLDMDGNGAADAGLSENIALITKINGDTITGVKTYPGADSDPDEPASIFPEDGQITVEITGVAAGKVYPVVYVNAGSTTFLEVDADGAATETYSVGGGLTVSGSSGIPVVIPNVAQTLAPGATVNYTISGLLDTQAYRVTLVLGANATVNFTNGTFLDADANGAADAGASENVALITAVNGADITGTKTVPGADSDPAAPTDVFPVEGKISVEITGVATGTVYPVAYVNAGTTTFLELNASGAPSEVYSIGGAINVQ
jgi:uncharacterized protein (DUF1810 family)